MRLRSAVKTSGGDMASEKRRISRSAASVMRQTMRFLGRKAKRLRCVGREFQLHCIRVRRARHIGSRIPQGALCTVKVVR